MMNVLKGKGKSILIMSIVAIGFFLLGYFIFAATNKTPTGRNDNSPELQNNTTQNNPANQTNAGISNAELPEEYPLNTAVDNGDYVNLHGKIYNDDVMADFLNKVADKESAFIRTVIYTVEGDPIIIDFSYNSKYFSVTKDATRDRHSSDEITNRRFDNLVIYEDVDPERYGDGKRTYYIVSDLSEITKESFSEGFDHEILKYD